MTTQAYSLNVSNDFILRHSKGPPIPALSELIWNSLDADATEVTVEIEPDGLGGMSKIVVADNGHGIPRAEAPERFSNLGNSWKLQSNHTRGLRRQLHGEGGRGRFKAFALADAVDWHVVYERDGTLYRYTITILQSDLTQIRVTEDVPHPGGSPGVTVSVSEIKKNFSSLEPENAAQDLSEIFAIYLTNYSDAHIYYCGRKLDPDQQISNKTNFDLSPYRDDDGNFHEVFLEIIEWKRQTKRALYLCNSMGFPLSQVSTRFHVGDFHFSAYLKSTAIDRLHNEERLELADMDPALSSCIEESRLRIKQLFRARSAEKARQVVDKWKEQNLYPFEGEAKTDLERVERNIFDIVAVTVQDASSDFETTPPQQTALHLRLLRHAIEKSPNELQVILGEVLKLPKRKQEELAGLLDETDLSGIISAAKLVADRIKFLDALKIILFDYEARKKVKERSQLHKILEQNTWIFGEEYHLWASDKDLTNVLRAHKAKLDPDIVIDHPVKVVGKERGIIDLMLSRSQRRHRANDIENLVIELKAPRVKLTANDLLQIEGYALAVRRDVRFQGVSGLKWHFWLVGDEYDEAVEDRIKGGKDPQRRLVTQQDTVSVGVKTWSEIIEENEARLQFIKEALEHHVDDGQALAHLQEHYRDLVEGVFVEDAADDGDGLAAG